MTADDWARVKSRLAEVLVASADERPALIDRLCGTDAAMLEEVRSLIAAHDGTGVLDDEPVLPPSISSADGLLATEVRAGRESVIGPYRLERRLGSGGMGEVFLATDTRLNRAVAVKVLHPRLDVQPRFAQHLLREARAAARLNHPHVAAVYDVIDDSGRVSLVMEYLPGETLTARLRRGRLNLGTVLSFARQMASALAHAHGQGVLHCDFKPANVMVTADDQLKVLDFGLARTLAGTDSEALGASPSLVRHRAGTPAYMSPEHRLGLPLGPATDVYSLGIVLHELATGHRPAEPGAIASGESTTAAATDPVLSAQVPRALRAVIRRATHSDLAQRTPTAQEVLDALSRIRDRRAAGWWTLAACLLAALGVLAGGSLQRGLPPASFHEHERAVVAEFQDLTGDPSLARTVREAVVMALQQSRFVNLLSGGRVADALSRMQRPEGTVVDEATALEIARREGARAVLGGTLARAGGTTQVTVRGLEGASGRLLFVESATFVRYDDVFGVVDALTRKIRRHLGESLAKIDDTSLPLQKVTTRSFEALRRYTDAVVARSQARMNDVEVPLQASLAIDPDFAMAHLKLGDFYLGIGGDTTRAIEHFARAHALSDRVTERERHFIAASYFSALERYDEARNSMRVLASLYPDDPDIRYELAMAHYALEDLAGATAQLEEVLRLDPQSTRAVGQLVLLLARDDRPTEALERQKRAAAAKLDSPMLHWGSGLAHLALGDADGAHREFRVLRDAGGFYDRLGLLQTARAALFQGDVTAAQRLYDEALRAMKAAGDVTLELAVRAQQGRTALLLGRPEEARRAADAILRAPASAVGAEELRRSAALAAESGDLRAARVAHKRLERLRRETGGSFIDFAFHHTAGVIALREGRAASALTAFRAAIARWPWYESRIGMARAFEASEEWQRALDERRQVNAVKGRVLRDGYPLDWRLNQLAAARLLMQIGQCDAAYAIASDTLTLIARLPDDALGTQSHTTARDVHACRQGTAGVRRADAGLAPFTH